MFKLEKSLPTVFRLHSDIVSFCEIFMSRHKRQQICSFSRYDNPTLSLFKTNHHICFKINRTDASSTPIFLWNSYLIIFSFVCSATVIDFIELVHIVFVSFTHCIVFPPISCTISDVKPCFVCLFSLDGVHNQCPCENECHVCIRRFERFNKLIVSNQVLRCPILFFTLHLVLLLL